MIWTILATAGLISASLTALLFWQNLRLFRAVQTLPDWKPDGAKGNDPADSAATISILIPARDEAGGIAAAIDAALASRGVVVEVVVLDDHSTDATPDILARKSAADPRVRFATSATLPVGWNGKQYACRQLADLARYDQMVFIDADVRLAPDGLARMVAYRCSHDAALLSAFPRQITGTILEKAIIPMMHYILLCFLPISRMRQSTLPAYSSGCGQLFFTDSQSYHAAGTHAALKGSRHDGLKLPRAFRESGLSTDVIDGTNIASCRMYTTASEVIRGALKNAIEGIANPRVIVPFTVFLLTANVLPIVAVVGAMVTGNSLATIVGVVAIIVSHLPRTVAAIQLRQSPLGAVTHVPAVCLFLVLQWTAFINHLLGRQIAWRGRTEIH